MEKLFLLASFLPEVRVRLEGKPALALLGHGCWYWESRVFVPTATGFAVCFVW